MSLPTEPPPGAEKKPWYRRWWGIALIVLFGLAFIGAVADDGGSEKVEVAQAASDAEEVDQPVEEPEPEIDERAAVAHEAALKRREEREQRWLEDKAAREAEEQAAREAEEQAAREAEEQAAREAEEQAAREAEEQAAREAEEQAAREAEEQAAREAEEAAVASAGQTNALRAARNYISIMPFSRSGLIKQLEFEGYPTGDATYAVDELAPNWNEQAAKAAKNYLDIMPFSRSGLIDQLVFEGYTREQATYGVNQTGL
jgi:colicin import membrane protein